MRQKVSNRTILQLPKDSRSQTVIRVVTLTTIANCTSGSLIVKRYLTSFITVAMLVGLGLTIGCQRAVEPVNDVVEPPPPEVPPEDLAALVEGNNQFALDLYKKLAETEKGNLFFSPYSISSALAMTYAGARGQTAEEMAKVLHFTLPQQKLHAALGGLTKSLQTAGKNRRYQLNIANSIWAQRGMQLVPEFLDITKDSYGACVREVDFANSDAARDTINRWVEQQTDDKIKAHPGSAYFLLAKRRNMPFLEG